VRMLGGGGDFEVPQLSIFSYVSPSPSQLTPPPPFSHIWARKTGWRLQAPQFQI